MHYTLSNTYSQEESTHYSLFLRVTSLFLRVTSLFLRVTSLFLRVTMPFSLYSVRLCDFLKYSQVFSRSSRKKKNGKESPPAWTKTKPLYVKLTDQNRTVTVSLFTILDERENDLLLHYLRECITRSSDSPLDGEAFH